MHSANSISDFERAITLLVAMNDMKSKREKWDIESKLSCLSETPSTQNDTSLNICLGSYGDGLYSKSKDTLALNALESSVFSSLVSSSSPMCFGSLQPLFQATSFNLALPHGINESTLCKVDSNSLDTHTVKRATGQRKTELNRDLTSEDLGSTCTGQDATETQFEKGLEEFPTSPSRKRRRRTLGSIDELESTEHPPKKQPKLVTLRFSKCQLGFDFFSKLDSLRQIDYCEAHGEFCIKVAETIISQLENQHEGKSFDDIVMDLEAWGELPKNLKFIGKCKKSALSGGAFYFRPSTLNWKYGELSSPLAAALACDIFHRLFHFRGDILLKRTSAYIPPGMANIAFEME